MLVDARSDRTEAVGAQESTAHAAPQRALDVLGKPVGQLTELGREARAPRSQGFDNFGGAAACGIDRIAARPRRIEQPAQVIAEHDCDGCCLVGRANDVVALQRTRREPQPADIAVVTQAIERGLRELVAWGLVTADGFQGLRQLTGGMGQTRNRAVRSMYGGGLFSGAGPSGRWTLVSAPAASDVDTDLLAEAIARVLLNRYGVVFRDVVMKESLTLPWRETLRALRRLEARGLVRGGRFVSGFVGEQYALPEAVDALRRVRREERNGERAWVSAVDPMNLSGIIIPGARVPAQPGKGILFVDGLPAEGAPPPPSHPDAPPSSGKDRPSRTPVLSKA